MNKILLASLLGLTCASASAAEVGVSVSVAQPGFYGQINIGGAPAPAVVYAQPMIVEQPAVVALPPPIYLRVPPGYAEHWHQHCYEYHACNRPVYFVRDTWYQQVYVPYYRQHREDYDRHDHGRGHGYGHDKDHGDWDHGGGDHGHGHGHDHGPDRD